MFIKQIFSYDMIKLINFVKKNQNVENYFISKEFIPFTTDKASFINLPNHNRHIGVWLSNKFIYQIEKYSEQVAIGLIYNNSYPIIKYDENLKRNIWKYLTGTVLINLYNQYKQNYFIQMKKVLFSS
ncbi:Spiroplasmavirus-related protein [Spiroplasma kunkelii CR2-3x]|uniref:Spiroplasmavirus-related protein n=1 Tax=Spiroplasma kunkelii CR2-3x TaxID=273035 RepID=A0A0K2JJ17_SPIKU|nr:Spiroplasmavirus-related protein [Spiroplasma kunkelii CR2-3x]